MHRGAEHLRRGALLDDAALVEHVNPGRRALHQRHRVGDEQQRQPLAGKPLEEPREPLRHRRIEGARRLVQQQDLGLDHQRAGDGHALLLAPAELPGEGAQLVLQTHAGKLLAGARRGLLAGDPVGPARREGEVLQHREVREQVVLLEDQPGPAPHAAQQLGVPALARPGRQAQAPQGNFPLVEGLQADQAPERRALPAPRHAHQRRDRPRMDLHAHAVKDRHGAPANPEATDRDQGCPPGRRRASRRRESRARG